MRRRTASSLGEAVSDMSIYPSEAEQERLSKLLDEAVGRCILEWAEVEFELSIIFQLIQGAVSGRDNAIAHSILGAVRSFEARLLMIHMAMQARIPDPDDPLRSDWKLFYNYCTSQCQLRNQIAHASRVSNPAKGEPSLIPFFNVANLREHIDREEVERRAEAFRELARALGWLTQSVRERLPNEPKYPRPIPDLLLRLRSEAAQRRAKHGRPPR
jgi:hypothetical protein